MARIIEDVSFAVTERASGRRPLRRDHQDVVDEIANRSYGLGDAKVAVVEQLALGIVCSRIVVVESAKAHSLAKACYCAFDMKPRFPAN